MIPLRKRSGDSHFVQRLFGHNPYFEVTVTSGLDSYSSSLCHKCQFRLGVKQVDALRLKVQTNTITRLQ